MRRRADRCVHVPVCHACNAHTRHHAHRLFPPCTGLSCRDVYEHGVKRCLLVSAQVSTARLDTKELTTPDAVPAGATAVTFNATAVQTTEPSYLSIVPGDVGATDTSTVNWVGPGETVANASLSRLGGDRQLRVIAGPYGTFHSVIDITGYYL